MKTNSIPKIRFKGFTDDWEQRKLGEIADKVTKKNKDIVVDEVFTNSAEFGIISQRDFFDKEIANAENIGGYYIVEPNDFVYNPRISTTAPFGPIKRNKLERTGAMSPLYYVFRPHGIDLSYLEWYFQTTCWHAFMRVNGNSGARSDRFAITDKTFNKMLISVPQDIEEQRKVGTFLTELDHLITLHQRKCEQTKELKKFMLQKMFPKKGEKNPEIRFPGFTDDWEQRKLGDVFDERSERASGNEELLSVTISNGVIRQIDSEKRNIASEDKSNYKVVKKGDVPYNSMRMWQGAVGTSDYDGIVSPAYTVLIPKNNCNGKFFMELFKKQPTLEIFKRWSQGLTSDTWNLKYPVLSTIPFMVPSVKEQEKIAEYFKSLDNLITLHQRKCEQLKELKKFMLQNMFPKKG